MKPSTGTGRRRRSRGQDDHPHAGERWLISYADLLTLLFALFVVLYAAADQDRAQAVANAIAEQFYDAKTDGARRVGDDGVLPDADVLVTREALEKKLNASPALRASTSVSSTKGGFIVSLADAGFFDAGAADLRTEAVPMIAELAASLRDSAAMIRVEGHTDTVPIATARFPSNWELSTARAARVLTELLAHGIQPSRLSVAGYAGERPVADNATSEGRARNRRVDLVVLQ